MIDTASPTSINNPIAPTTKVTLKLCSRMGLGTVSTFLWSSSSPLKVQSQNRPFLAIVILAISVLIIGIVGASPWRRDP
jgi:hypothetical protein